MEVILPKLGEAFGLTAAWAFRFDAARSSFVEVGASGLPPALAVEDARPLKVGWCECQDQFVHGKLATAVNVVRCSRLRDAIGEKQDLVYHASIPLRTKDKALGILNVAASGRQVFTEESLALLETIGHHVAVALDRSALLADETQRANQLRALVEMAAELTRLQDSNAFLEPAVTQFVETLGYEACGIVQPAYEEGHEGKLVALAHQQSNDEEPSYTYDSDTATPLLPADARLLLDQARSFIAKSIPNTPFSVRLESKRTGVFADPDEDLLSAFALFLGAALQNAKSHQQSLASAKWAERRKLAADLHDAVSQRLFSANLIAKAASLMLSDQMDTEHIQDRLVRLQELLAESQEEMRDLIKTLRPLDERSFATRLKERVQPLQLQSLTKINVHYDCPDFPLLPRTVDALLLVVDEAMHNILKHARAKQTDITVAIDWNSLQMVIQDDGVGFEVNGAGTQHGLGTSTMEERIKSLGGRFALTSVPGSGTTVTCKIPLQT